MAGLGCGSGGWEWRFPEAAAHSLHYTGAKSELGESYLLGTFAGASAPCGAVREGC